MKKLWVLVKIGTNELVDPTDAAPYEAENRLVASGRIYDEYSRDRDIPFLKSSRAPREAFLNSLQHCGFDVVEFSEEVHGSQFIKPE